MINSQYFSHHSNDIKGLKGKEWDDRKSDYLNAIKRGRSQEQAAQKMRENIKSRDIVDYVSYNIAISTIFPDFNLKARVKGTLKVTPNGEDVLASKWYEFVVKQRPDHEPTSREEKQSCEIKIDAPGSRTLTSDIDTSILTTFKGNSSFFENAVSIFKDEEKKTKDEEKKLKEIDFAGRVTKQVIDNFYKFSEKEFKMTSSTHRDSNAYADTLAKDKENYPKFLHDEENNPSIHRRMLFTVEEFTQEFTQHKYQKHVQEMAASLFSLRVSLEEKEWKEFKDQAKEQLRTILKAELGKLPGQQCDAYISACEQDYDRIFREVKDIHQEHSEALANKEKGREVQGLRRTLLNPKKDIKIAALNRLYVEYLEKCTNCYEQILALKSNKKPLMDRIDELGAEKEELGYQITGLKKHIESNKVKDAETEKLIGKKENRHNLLVGEYGEEKERLRRNILETARLQVKLHRAQILASTFAYEAYVCRSAVHHVVNGQKGAENQPISQQTLLGSALQQVGFKLLHTNELLHKGDSYEEVAYYTAKYGQRIFNLIFSGRRAELDNNDIKYVARGRTVEGFPQLAYLKSEQVRNNAYVTFEEEELALLNSQAKIIQRIKSNSKVSDADKPRETLELIQKLYPFSNEEEKKRYFEKEKKLYLSISAKLIGLVYASRLKHKGYLWGQNPSIPLLNKVEEKKEAESSIPLSNSKSLQTPKVPKSTSEEVITDQEEETVDIDSKQDEDSTRVVLGVKRVVSKNAEMKGNSYALIAAGYTGEIALPFLPSPSEKKTAK
ncbi:hypothetical protein [Parachlamydia sp. AcF125]|uniref:hypothetical protein n=1 Tax=Parachlamydia sp. AcF125 TaxID=2795736 RepID=UPI001BC9AB0F|nr:hypothetical protein [Parachlamydia sp. AcF125]MBS4169088.1 hypothetical protein [Parachlamydia sp. AcF125]